MSPVDPAVSRSRSAAVAPDPELRLVPTDLLGVKLGARVLAALSQLSIDAAIVVDGERVPVHVWSRSAAWAVVSAVPTPYSRTWRLLKGETRRVAATRLLPVKGGDLFWWRR